MLPRNIGSPRDAATLGEIGSAFPATHVLPLQLVFFFLFPPKLPLVVQLDLPLPP